MMGAHVAADGQHPTSGRSKTILVALGVLLALALFYVVLTVVGDRQQADRELRAKDLAIQTRDKALALALQQGKENGQQLTNLTALVRDQNREIAALSHQLAKAGITPVDLASVRHTSDSSQTKSQPTTRATGSPSTGTKGGSGKPSPSPTPSPSKTNTGLCLPVVDVCIG